MIYSVSYFCTKVHHFKLWCTSLRSWPWTTRLSVPFPYWTPPPVKFLATVLATEWSIGVTERNRWLYGISNLPHPFPSNSDTRWHVPSVSKSHYALKWLHRQYFIANRNVKRQRFQNKAPANFIYFSESKGVWCRTKGPGALPPHCNSNKRLNWLFLTVVGNKQHSWRGQFQSRVSFVNSRTSVSTHFDLSHDEQLNPTAPAATLLFCCILLQVLWFLCCIELRFFTHFSFIFQYHSSDWLSPNDLICVGGVQLNCVVSCSMTSALRSVTQWLTAPLDRYMLTLVLPYAMTIDRMYAACDRIDSYATDCYCCSMRKFSTDLKNGWTEQTREHTCQRLTVHVQSHSR